MTEEEEKDKKQLAEDCENIYADLIKVFENKKALPSLMVSGTFYVSVCRYIRMTKDEMLAKTSDVWDAMEILEEDDK